MTTRRQFVPPPRWDDETLESRRRRAIADFVQERSEEGATPYREAFARNLERVQALFQQTQDLLDLGTGAALAASPDLISTARYLSGPPISADDLDTLAGSRISSRPPTAAERDLACRWTAGLQTVQEVQTKRRGESSRRQQLAVEELLRTQGLTMVSPRPVVLLDDLARGEFSRESIVGGAKCDVPVRLRDGRLLLIECKVSNSATNSVKRLNRECGNKSSVWLSRFGAQAVPAAVLAGVFTLKNLADAQTSDHVTIFWEHELETLAQFLNLAV